MSASGSKPPITPKSILQALTAPAAGKTETTNEHKLDTLVVGMGPVGLAAGLAALARGESVAFLTDRPVETGLGVRPQTLSVDDESFSLMKELLSRPVTLPNTPQNRKPETGVLFQSILEKYLHYGMIVQDTAQQKNRFTIGNMEKALLELLEHFKQAGAKAQVIEVERLDKELIKRLSMDRQDVDEKMRGDIAALRQKQSVDLAGCTLTVSGVKKMDGQQVSNEASRRRFKFHNLQICNGEGQSIEKGMLEVGGDNVRLDQPTHPYHAAVVFQLKGVPYSTLDKILEAVSADAVKTSPVPLKILANLGWENESRPFSLMYTSGSGPDEKGGAQADQFYIGCQIPKKLYDEYNDPTSRAQAEMKIRQYAYLLVKDKVPAIFVRERIAPSDTPMAVSPFKLGFHQLDRSLVLSDTHLAETGSPGVVGFFGDGLMSPLYTTGTGLQTALKLLNYFHAAQLKIKELKCPCSEAAVGAIFNEYHVKAQQLLVQIGEVQDRVILQDNERLRKAAMLKNMFGTMQAAAEGMAGFLSGFTVTLSTPASPSPVKTTFTLETLPLTKEEKSELTELLHLMALFSVKNADSLVSYEAHHLFTPQHLAFHDEKECFDTFLDLSKRVRQMTERITARAPTVLESNQETPERFALRKISSRINGISAQIQSLKEIVLSEADKLQPAPHKSAENKKAAKN